MNITFTRGSSLPDSAQKTDFHNLVDLATGSGSNIVDADINGSANISPTKLAQITTAGKVSGAALTSLSSTPAGAGIIPVANIDVGTTANKILQLDSSAKIPAVDGSQLTNTNAGKWVAEQTGTVTAQSSFTISSLTAGARYRLVFNFVQNTSNGLATLRFNADSASNYNWSLCESAIGGVSASGSDSDTSICLMRGAAVHVATKPFSGWVEFQPSAASNNTVYMTGVTYWYENAASHFAISTIGGAYLGSAGITSLSILTSAGTVTGSWAIYRLS